MMRISWREVKIVMDLVLKYITMIVVVMNAPFVVGRVCACRSLLCEDYVISKGYANEQINLLLFKKTVSGSFME